MFTNQIKGKVSLLSVASAMMMSPTAALAEEAVAEDREQERSRRGEEIIVTGRSLSSADVPTATPVQILSGDELAHRRQGGLGETLAGLPGMHLDNFGGGASRPVIRGQTVPRIEILSDGANLFDVSSVSPDHAITTEPLLLDAIEVLRGPAATRYGGNALNGAINLIDSKVPKVLPEGGLSGATEVRFGTGDEEKTVAGRVTAGLGPFAIHAEGSRRRSDDYAVPDAYESDKLRDSFANSSSYAFGASWITSKGYLGASYTRQDSEYGLPGHSHINGVCHTHGTDLHCAAHDEFEDPFGSSDDHTAYIKLRSERVDVRADYDDLLPALSHARLRLSYTDYQHDEIDGPALFSHYTNKVYDARVELTHAPFLGFTGTLGGQYSHGTFGGINVNDLHEPPSSYSAGFVGDPRYVTENIGVFLSERRSFGPIDLEIAARKDWRDIDIPFTDYVISPASLQAVVDAYDARNGAGAFRKSREVLFRTANPLSKHAPFSASLAMTWRIGDGYSAALSLARTERAPSVRELYAYGNNLATNSYEVGLSQTGRASSSFPEARTDVMETAKSVNLTFRKTGGPIEFEVGLFHQDIDDYVFARLIETEMETGVPHHYLVYTAADARFTGIDGQVSYRFTPESRVTVFGDYVDADLKSENDNLPRIPPGRLGARYEGNWGPLSADVEYSRTFGQSRIASYETKTDGYNMVNATLGYRFDVGLGKSVEFYARGTNLTNELAFSHTSFVKNQSPLRGRSIAFGMRHLF